MSATLPGAVLRSRELVGPALAAALDRLHPRLRDIAAYHRGWVDADGRPEPVAATGKALRPALAVLGAEAVGASPEVALPGAVAVELVHDFSLLHDDVMDGDRMRRHRPTAWTVFGVGPALLAGDALLALATSLLGEVDGPQGRQAALMLSRAVEDLVAGQADDLGFETRLDVDLDAYLHMAGGKTGALLSCSCAIGAALAGAPERTVDGLAAVGRHLGLAFQLVDDLLGIWGTTDATGKPVLSDLRSRKKSAPVVVALVAGGPAVAPLRAHLTADVDVDAPVDEIALGDLAALIERIGARAAVEAEADRQLSLAEEALAGLSLRPDVEAELLTTARYVTGRDR